MSSEERSELKQRADAFQAERARNPDFQPGEARLNRTPGQLPTDASEPKVRAKATKGTKGAKAKQAKATKSKAQRAEKPAQKKKKRGRSFKDLPGAFVR
jgi:hypothetical protein